MTSPETEREWLTTAEALTVRQLERLVSGRRRGDRPTDLPRAELQRHPLRLEVTGEAIASFRQALEHLRRRSGENLDALRLPRGSAQQAWTSYSARSASPRPRLLHRPRVQEHSLRGRSSHSSPVRRRRKRSGQPGRAVFGSSLGRAPKAPCESMAPSRKASASSTRTGRRTGGPLRVLIAKRLPLQVGSCCLQMCAARGRARVGSPSSRFSHSVGFWARRSRVGNRTVAVGARLVDGTIRVKFIERWISSI
jgi:hypothetical protein